MANAYSLIDEIGLPPTTLDDAELIAHILTSSQGDSVFAPYDGVKTHSTQRNFLSSRNLYSNGYTSHMNEFSPHANGHSSRMNGYHPRMNGNVTSNGYTQVDLGKAGCINGNVLHQGSDPFGINNVGLDEEIDTSSFCQSRGFEIEYIKYPDAITKVQVSPLLARQPAVFLSKVFYLLGCHIQLSVSRQYSQYQPIFFAYLLMKLDGQFRNSGLQLFLIMCCIL